MKNVELLKREIRKFESSWIAFIKYIIQIKNTKKYKSSFECKTFKEFCKKHMKVHEKTIYKMIRSFKFISSNRPEILTDENAYIPNYGYVHYIFTKCLNDSQRKNLENLIFSGATKKDIKMLLDSYKKASMTPKEAQSLNFSQLVGFAKSFKNKVGDLLSFFTFDSDLRDKLMDLEITMGRLLKVDIVKMKKELDYSLSHIG